MVVIIEQVCRILFIFIGGFGIGQAIRSFRKQSYFTCGIWIMLAVSMAIHMVELVMLFNN